MSHKSIAIIGARGIANYGGFETFVGEFAPKLARRGYDVFVSHRSENDTHRPSMIAGVRVLYFPLRFPRSSKLGRLFEVLYDWYFVLLCAILIRCQVIYCLGIAAGPVLPLARLFGSVTVLNLDGLEWRRPKFQLTEKLYIKSAFLSSCLFADHLVLDNGRLLDYIPERSKSKASVIPYGVTPRECSAWDGETLREYAEGRGSLIEPGRFWLVVARLEPDNLIHMIVEAYARSPSILPLVIVGSFSSTQYAARIADASRSLGPGKNVIMMGSVYDQNHLSMLRCNCFSYIHGHSVGGTNPSLLEAMSVGNIVIAHDNPFNREVCGENAIFFKNASELAAGMAQVERNREGHANLGEGARLRAIEAYGWEDVVMAYEVLFNGLLSRR
jgi:rhamnosyltransferase